MDKLINILYKYEQLDINNIKVVTSFVEEVITRLVYIYNLEEYIKDVKVYNNINDLDDLTYFSIINKLVSINVLNIEKTNLMIGLDEDNFKYLIKLMFIIFHELSHSLEFKHYEDKNINLIEYHLSNIFNRDYHNDEYIRSKMNIYNITIDDYYIYSKNLNNFIEDNNILDPNEIVANNFAFKNIIKVLKTNNDFKELVESLNFLYYEYSLSFYNKNDIYKNGLTNIQVNNLIDYKDCLDSEFYSKSINELLNISNKLTKKQKLYYSLDLTNEEYNSLVSKSKKFKLK